MNECVCVCAQAEKKKKKKNRHNSSRKKIGNVGAEWEVKNGDRGKQEG